MSKKTTRQTDFVKWFGLVLDALRALGGFARPKEITKRIAETRKTFSNKASSIFRIKTGFLTGYIDKNLNEYETKL